MPYASFRCAVQAPVQETWSTLQATLLATSQSESSNQLISHRIGAVSIQEEVLIDDRTHKISLRINGAKNLSGLRKFRLKAHENQGVMLECILDWQSAEIGLTMVLAEHLEELVKSPLMSVKSQVEEARF